MWNENQLSNQVIGLALDVHRALGPGLLENTYKECLFYKLRKSNFQVEKERVTPLIFEGVSLECGYRIDLLVEGKLVIEIKSISEIKEVHIAQALTYLRLGNFKLALLINFNVARLTEGIRRVVNRLEV